MSSIQPMELVLFLQQASLLYYNEVHKINLKQLRSYLPEEPELVYDGRTKLVFRWFDDSGWGGFGKYGTLDAWVEEVNKGLLDLGVENLKLDIDEVYNRANYYVGSPDFFDVLIEFV